MCRDCFPRFTLAPIIYIVLKKTWVYDAFWYYIIEFMFYFILRFDFFYDLNCCIAMLKFLFFEKTFKHGIPFLILVNLMIMSFKILLKKNNNNNILITYSPLAL